MLVKKKRMTKVKRVLLGGELKLMDPAQLPSDVFEEPCVICAVNMSRCSTEQSSVSFATP